jgi:hypothetical protein
MTARLTQGSTSWVSLGDAQALARLEAGPVGWKRFLAHAVTVCRQPGAVDGETHILLAERRQNTEVSCGECSG